ncbi:MAG: hypothetical protein QNJ05_15640 [Woeseiaceae bacterium]|nr:hypothetical protein [Woeseiaceae bacterium]
MSILNPRRGQSRRRPRSTRTSLLSVAIIASLGSIATAQNAGSFAEKIGNTTAFEEPASTYLHCMVLLTAYDSIPEAVAGLDTGMVKTIFGLSKEEIGAAVTASKGYADAFSAKIATLDPPLSAEQQLSYTGEFNTVMSSDMAAMLASPDHERCLSYADEHGITP